MLKRKKINIQKPKLTTIQKLENLKSKCTDINFLNQCITSYQHQTKVGVENTLMMCDTVNLIHQKVKKGELLESDLDYFCNSVGLDKKSSSFRKLICISNHSDKFRKYIERTPSAISVLYEITTLDPDLFERLIKSNILNQSITLSEVKRFTNKSSPKFQTNAVSVKINFDLEKTTYESAVYINQMMDYLRVNNEIRVFVQNEPGLKQFLNQSVRQV